MKYISNIFILLFFIFTSCKKESNSLVNGDKIYLTISIKGITDLENIAPKKANAINTYNSQQFIASEKPSTINLEQVALEISSESQPMFFNNNEERFDKLKGNKLASTSSPMKDGITYWLLLYNTTTKRFEQSVLITNGQNATSLAVVNGQEYEYYAYSYNNSEQITNPALNNYIINTPTDKPLVYASGTITPTSNNQVLDLTFRHKLAQIVVDIDYDRLFGDVTSINATFAANTNLNTGKFNILRNEITDVVNTTPPSPIAFTDVDIENQINSARFYVVDPSAFTSFTVNINELSVKYINNTTAQLISSPREIIFGTPTNPYIPAIGKQLIGKVKLWKYFTAKKVLHFTTNTQWGYAANVAASYNMIHENLNYGTDARSLCKFFPGTTNAFISVAITEDNIISASIDNEDPDIIILALDYSYTTADVEKLLDFVDAGGVLINFANEGSIPEVELFLQTFFKTPSITVSNVNNNVPGYVFPLVDFNDEILNGAFGDVREKYWGADDAHGVQAYGVPTNDITVYSSNTPVNGSGTQFTGVNMFKHNKYHFFWFGDGGFLSGPTPNGCSFNTIYIPFSTVNIPSYQNPNSLFNYDNYPYPTLNYGYGNTGQAIYDVYNSTLFANIMSWAVVNAEFFGYNTGGLPSSPVDF